MFNVTSMASYLTYKNGIKSFIGPVKIVSNKKKLIKNQEKLKQKIFYIIEDLIFSIMIFRYWPSISMKNRLFIWLESLLMTLILKEFQCVANLVVF